MTIVSCYFDRVKSSLQREWGLSLTRNCPDRADGWTLGSWKSGFSVSGHFPGIGSTWRRFTTLKRVVSYFDLPMSVK